MNTRASEPNSAARTLRAAVTTATDALTSSESPRLDAELLLAHVLACDRVRLYRDFEQTLSEPHLHRVNELVKARQAGRPIAQLIGAKEFYSLELKVDSHTLIPRPETELLVDLALELLATAPPGPILELGTGTGAIAIAIASASATAIAGNLSDALPTRDLTALEIDPAALAVAQQNATLLRLPQINFRVSDWFEAARDERFALIVSNPPYVASGDPGLSQPPLCFEPRLALDGGVEGLDCIGAIIDQAPGFLIPDGCIVLEHGNTQGAAVRQLLARSFVDIETHGDLAGHERVTIARKRSSK